MPKAFKASEKPNSKDLTNTGSISDDKKEFIRELRASVSEDDDSRDIWKNKMIIATNQRLGVRRYSHTPYPNAPNIPLPETDKLIKKSTPNLVLSTFAPKKKALVRVKDGVQETPELKEKARRAELVINMILNSKQTNFFHKLQLAADFAKQHGHMIVRTVEDFRSRIRHEEIDLEDIPENIIVQLKAASKEQLRQFVAQRYFLDIEDEDELSIINDVIKQFRSGKKLIEFDIEEVSSLPNIEIPLPTKIIVPSYTTDINKANRVTYEYFLTRNELEKFMENGTYIEKDLKDLKFNSPTKGSDSDLVEEQKKRNEGITDGTEDTDLYRIWETLCWFKPKGGSTQRWTFTTFADVFDPEESLLQDMQFPYDFEDDTWNYDKWDNEVKDPRYYNSRGVPEQIRALQEISEKAINNMLIRDEMNNTPMWEVLNTSDILDGNTTFGPGKMLPVEQIGAEIKRLNEPSTVDISSDRIMQIVKATAEEYLGNSDQLFRNATNAGGGKTLGEIKEGIRQTTGPLNVEVISWNDTWGRVYQKMFDILKDRLEESIFIEDIEITREDFQFPAEVRSNGNLEVSDKQLAVQKSLFRLNTIAQFMQAGVVDQEDVFNALQDWLEKDGIKNPDNFSTDPKKILQTQLAQLQQQVQQLQAQAQQLDQVVQEGNKDVAKIQEKGKKAVADTAGKLEAKAETK